MSEPRIQPRFAVGETVWAVSSYGAIISGPVTEVSDRSPAVHFIGVGSREVVAHPCFATEVECLEYAANQVEVELCTLRSRLRSGSHRQSERRRQ